jgi:hypothetical protein
VFLEEVMFQDRNIQATTLVLEDAGVQPEHNLRLCQMSPKTIVYLAFAHFATSHAPVSQVSQAAELKIEVAILLTLLIPKIQSIHQRGSF